MSTTEHEQVTAEARSILLRDFWAIEDDACAYLYRVRIARDRAALKALEHGDRAAARRAEVYDALAGLVENEYL